MRIVFMGTPRASAETLHALAAKHDVVLVLTQPAKPAGRGLQTRPSPVWEEAEFAGLEVAEPPTLKDELVQARLSDLAADAIVVVAFGQILPAPVLAAARLGCVNVHFSLLPRWRGAAPVERAIMAGDRFSGVTTMLMDEGLDTGPILLQEREPILESDTGGSLLERLTPVGARLLLTTLEGLESGSVKPKAQPDAAATYARRLGPREAELAFELPAKRLVDQIRALDPDPGAFTWFRGRRLKVWRGAALPGSGRAGSIATVDASGPDVATGDGRLRLLELQPEGRNRMTGAEFVRGYRPAVREDLGARSADEES
jgi:methionyl-tRNA formyltransferase